MPDECGLIWYSPLLPLRSRDLRCLTEIADPICLQYGINPQITFTVLSSTFCDCTLPIVFDKRQEERTAAARQCYLELFSALRNKGYLPYRYGIDQMSLLTGEGGAFWSAVSSLKGALDPHAVISPGRYHP